MNNSNSVSVLQAWELTPHRLDTLNLQLKGMTNFERAAELSRRFGDDDAVTISVALHAREDRVSNQ